MEIDPFPCRQAGNNIALQHSAAKPGDAWSLKLALADLEKNLGEKSERIGRCFNCGWS